MTTLYSTFQPDMEAGMVEQLLAVGLLVLAGFCAGWLIGWRRGHARALQWERKTESMARLLEAATFDEPGSPRMN